METFKLRTPISTKSGQWVLLGDSCDYQHHIFLLESILNVQVMPTPPRSIGTKSQMLSIQYSWWHMYSYSSRSFFGLPDWSYRLLSLGHGEDVWCPHNKLSVRARFCFDLSLSAHWLRQKQNHDSTVFKNEWVGAPTTSIYQVERPAVEQFWSSVKLVTTGARALCNVLHFHTSWLVISAACMFHSKLNHPDPRMISNGLWSKKKGHCRKEGHGKMWEEMSFCIISTLCY